MTSPAPLVTAAAAEVVDPRFHAFLAASTDPSLPPEIASAISAGLLRQYAAPPVAATEAVLKHNATSDRVRQLIYWPTEDDARSSTLDPD
jgi:hypothetical protein